MIPDEEINLIIAEWMGWKRYTYGEKTILAKLPEEVEKFWLDEGASITLDKPVTECLKVYGEMPDCVNDSNAIRKAEQALREGDDCASKLEDYQLILWMICNPGIEFCADNVFDVEYMQNFISATHRQRAEALAKAIQQWKE